MVKTYRGSAFVQTSAVLLFVGLMYWFEWYPPYWHIVLAGGVLFCIGALIDALDPRP